MCVFMNNSDWRSALHLEVFSFGMMSRIPILEPCWRMMRLSRLRLDMWLWNYRMQCCLVRVVMAAVVAGACDNRVVERWHETQRKLSCKSWMLYTRGVTTWSKVPPMASRFSSGSKESIQLGHRAYIILFVYLIKQRIESLGYSVSSTLFKASDWWKAANCIQLWLP